MASRTRTYTSTRTNTGSTTPTRVQILPPNTSEEGGDVKCTGHGMKCPKLKAGPTAKNPGRAFYCCPLPRSDPKRCNFFKWHDEIFPSGKASASAPASTSVSAHRASDANTIASGSSRAARLVAQTNASGARTLGQSPQARYGKPDIPTTPSSHSGRMVVKRPPSPDPVDTEEIDDEIDWEQVDTDEIEREAIASTPGSSRQLSQATNSAGPTPSTVRTSHGDTVIGSGGEDGVSLTERLRGVVDDDVGLGKRKRDEGEPSLRTPKRAVDASNPFLATTPTSPRSPPHGLLTPTLSSLDQLSEHLHRQDRLLRAAEQMKQGMRSTIKTLQEKNGVLEDRVKELEKQLKEK